ncbi:dynein light chain roadblock-type 2-like [Teleopsis dalmanni]|uniref:dynein light chain roadblock-type 2-like n=1 Tax=Teleopsis dalmanni TaxID=139649 RepID=UPI0018CCEA6D|nr:dynein light chain roadblock-type 2-like [Teleopsis dalmanni]XP_037960232.1 dynein light chain roadblock-type 2-like [Teleopsis dalmanni]
MEDLAAPVEEDFFTTLVRKHMPTTQRIMQKAKGCLIYNAKTAESVYSTYHDNTEDLASNVCDMLVCIARNAVREVNPIDELRFLRIATKDYEFLIAPTDEFVILVEQLDPSKQPVAATPNAGKKKKPK